LVWLQVIETCSIIRHTLLADLHDRMPVIRSIRGSRKQTFVTFEASLMRRYEVSSRVNSARNDDPACAEAVPWADAAAGMSDGAATLDLRQT